MVVQGSPGEAAGIKAGDIITRVGGVDVPARDRGVPAVVSMIRDSPGVPITLHVNRCDADGTLTEQPPSSFLSLPPLLPPPSPPLPFMSPVGISLAPAFSLYDPAVICTPRPRPAARSTRRNGTEFDVDVVPDASPSGGRIGVQLVTNVEAKYRPAQGLADAATAAWRDMTRLSSAIATGLGQIFTNFTQAAEQVSGPVAIVAVGAEVVRRDAAGAW